MVPKQHERLAVPQPLITHIHGPHAQVCRTAAGLRQRHQRPVVRVRAVEGRHIARPGQDKFPAFGIHRKPGKVEHFLPCLVSGPENEPHGAKIGRAGRMAAHPHDAMRSGEHEMRRHAGGGAESRLFQQPALVIPYPVDKDADSPFQLRFLAIWQPLAVVPPNDLRACRVAHPHNEESQQNHRGQNARDHPGPDLVRGEDERRPMDALKSADHGNALVLSNCRMQMFY